MRGRGGLTLRRSLDDPAPEPFRHNPGLDGVRGLGILVVMFGHYSAGLSEWAQTRLFGFSLIIDLFFVLSGYLITALLLEEWSKARDISMRKFYVRRGLRLVPALYVLLAVVLVLGLFTDLLPISPKMTIAETGSAALYVYPLVLIPKGDQAFLLHLWTLSVEEWFYFLWPAFLLYLGLRPGTDRRLRMVVWSLVGFSAACFALRAVGGDDGLTRLVASLRPDTLAYGTLVAFLLRWLQLRRVEPTPGIARFDRVLDVIGPLGFVGLVWFAFFANYPRPPGLSELEFHDISFVSWNYRLGMICAAVAIVHVANRSTGRIARTMSWRPLTYLGALSYALYLWHQPVFLVLNGKAMFNSDPGVEGHVVRSLEGMWAIGLLAAAISFVIALASRRFVELPALRLKQRFETVKRHDATDISPERAPS